MTERKRCATNGKVPTGAMCGHIVVGRQFCGYEKEGLHQRESCSACEGFGFHPTGDKGVKCGGCNGSGLSEDKP